MQKIKMITIILITCCLTACSGTHRHKNYCQESQTIPRAVIPAGLSSAKIKDKYPAPSVNTNIPPNSVSLIPPGVGK